MDRHKVIREHRIEQLLLNAHIEREAGQDLIEEYFLTESSLDHITSYANHLLERQTDPEVKEAIIKNLSECIVVKAQKERRSLLGFVRIILTKVGLEPPKNSEIKRAEILISREKQ